MIFFIIPPPPKTFVKIENLFALVKIKIIYNLYHIYSCKLLLSYISLIIDNIIGLFQFPTNSVILFSSVSSSFFLFSKESLYNLVNLSFICSTYIILFSDSCLFNFNASFSAVNSLSSGHTPKLTNSKSESFAPNEYSNLPLALLDTGPKALLSQ